MADGRGDDLQDEIEAHLRMAIADRMARGESREAAERGARAEFGNLTHVKEVTREARGGLWVERLGQDVRYGLRALRRTPAFTAVAVLTLALAIGANSAVFTVVNSVLLQPLPFHEPERLFLASHRPTNLPFELPPGLDDRLHIEYRTRARSFEQVAGYQRQQFTLSGVGDAARLVGARVSANFFSTIGVSAALGRTFAPDEERDGRDRVVVLSYRLWRERFNGDSQVVGTVTTLDGTPRTVIGIMPPRFVFPADVELWTPLVMRLDPGNSMIVPTLGRLRSDATVEQARSELATIASARPKDPRAAGFTTIAAIIPLKDQLTRNVRKSLLIFAGAVAFVLLIACANVANLLLIRAAARRHEMAVRVALGAGRSRIARQLLTESILIGVIGGVIGVLLAFAGVRVLLAMAPEGRIPRLEEVGVDAWVLVFTLAVSLLTGLLFGVVPALHGSRREPHEALGQGVRTLGGSHNRLRATLVGAEIALALVLLTGAGLMVKSFVRMRSVDTGYDPERVVTMAVDLPRSTYPDPDRVHAFHGRLLERLAQIPGAHSVGAISFRPAGGMGIMGDFKVDGQTPVPNGFSVDKPTVSPGYFAAMGIRMLGGRDFTAADNGSAPGVVIVSESVARRAWPNESAVGKRISMQDRPGPNDWLTVVGVVNDIVQDEELSRHSTIYLPYLQTRSFWFIDHMTFVVRSDIGAQNVAPAMRAALREVDATIPAQALETMDESMLATIAEPLFQTRLLAVFSILALLLAAIGTYGVLAYDVHERTREISLRMALGATPGNVMRMVLQRTAILAVSGAAIGLLGALAVTNVLTKSLYEVKPTDPATFVAMTAMIVSVALMSGYIPARRATRVQALTALPHD
ncbi:MAG TPA: ABC transporter permease [Gemmatimonadaceae bacterium]|nr:ABC transporter permease [Gemmatimonadaceae bacterium]